jgi:hypothetical protein
MKKKPNEAASAAAPGPARSRTCGLNSSSHNEHARDVAAKQPGGSTCWRSSSGGHATRTLEFPKWGGKISAGTASMAIGIPMRYFENEGRGAVREAAPESKGDCTERFARAVVVADASFPSAVFPGPGSWRRCQHAEQRFSYLQTRESHRQTRGWVKETGVAVLRHAKRAMLILHAGGELSKSLRSFTIYRELLARPIDEDFGARNRFFPEIQEKMSVDVRIVHLSL